MAQEQTSINLIPIEEIARLDYVNNPDRQGSGGIYRASKMLENVFKNVVGETTILADKPTELAKALELDAKVYSRYDDAWTEAHLKDGFQSKVAILQLREGEENHVRRFLDVARLDSILHETPNCNNYELIYVREEEPEQVHSEFFREQRCNELYNEFNADTLRPRDYYGHSLSVGDVIVFMNDFAEHHAYFVDSFGFKKLPDDFLPHTMRAKIRTGLDVFEEYFALQGVENYERDNDASIADQTAKERLELFKEEYSHIFELAERRGMIMDMGELGYDYYFGPGGDVIYWQSKTDPQDSFSLDSWDDVRSFLSDIKTLHENYSLEQLKDIAERDNDFSVVIPVYGERKLHTAIATHPQREQQSQEVYPHGEDGEGRDNADRADRPHEGNGFSFDAAIVEGKFPRLNYVSISDTSTGWKDNGARDYGQIPGYVRGYNIEFRHRETGEINYNGALWVSGTIEGYYQEQMDAWGANGYTPFETERFGGWEPTGRAVMRGYAKEEYDFEEHETFVKTDGVDDEIEKMMRDNHYLLKDDFDPHKQFIENVIVEHTKLDKSKIICLDVETTGLNFEEDEIVQLSIIDGNGEVLFNEYIKPRNVAEWPGAEAISGISPAMVADKPTIDAYIPQLNEIMSSAELIVGYNSDWFDMTFIRNAGIAVPEDTKTFDVMREFAPIYGEWDERREDYKWQKLAFTAEYYGYKGEGNFHDSLEDVRATLYCYYAMTERERQQPKRGEAMANEKITFYVAEVMEFPDMGEHHEGLTSLEEAFDLYNKIPASRINGIKGIGFVLHDGSIYDGMPFPLMEGGRIRESDINDIEYYRNSPLVQKVIQDCKDELGRRSGQEYEATDLSDAPEDVKAELLRNAKELERREAERVYRLDDQDYLHIQVSDEGYDYTIYDENMRELDGGLLENPDGRVRTMQEARDEILALHELGDSKAVPFDLDTFDVLRDVEYKRGEKEVDAEQPAEEPLVDISNLAFDDEGYLHFTVSADGYELEGLYRVLDPANGEDMELVSIDYGEQHPIIERQWERIADALYDASLDRYNALIDEKFEHKGRVIQAMGLAGYVYNEEQSADGRRVFDAGEGGISFVNFAAAERWIEGYVALADDDKMYDEYKHVMYPERYDLSHLTDDQRRTVKAMEVVGYEYDATAKMEIVFGQKDNPLGYPITFRSWEEAREWIDSATFHLTENGKELLEAKTKILYPNSQPIVRFEDVQGKTYEYERDIYYVAGIKDGVVYLQSVNSDQHTEIPVPRFVARAVDVTERERLRGENPVGERDWYFNDPGRGEVFAVSFNPESTAGGQYVHQYIPYELILEAAKENSSESFFELINERSKQELVDIDTPEFKELLDHYKTVQPDFIYETGEFFAEGEPTMVKLIEVATNEFNKPLVTVAGIERRIAEINAERDKLNEDQYKYGYMAPKQELAKLYQEEQELKRILEVVANYDLPTIWKELDARFDDETDFDMSGKDGKLAKYSVYVLGQAERVLQEQDKVLSERVDLGEAVIEAWEKENRSVTAEQSKRAYALIRNKDISLNILAEAVRRTLDGELQPIPNRYYEPDLDLDGTADELFVQARDGYIENPEALAKLQEILSNPAEQKAEKAFYVGILKEIAENSEEQKIGEDYSLPEVKKDLLDGIGTIYLTPERNLSLEVRREGDAVLLALTDEETGAVGATTVPVERFLNMTATEFNETINAVYAYNMVEQQEERDDVMAKQQDEREESPVMVKTNMGEMPVEDYREIVAQQHGFDSYDEMYAAGIRIGNGYDKEPEVHTHGEDETVADMRIDPANAKLIHAYEALAEIPVNERIAVWHNNLNIYDTRMSVSDEQYMARLNEAIAAVGLKNYEEWVNSGLYRSDAASILAAMEELKKAIAEKTAPVVIDVSLAPKDQLKQRLENGVRSVLDSEKFKNWLNTGGKLFYNNYSFRNAMLVWLQKPDATYVMGYDKWKDFGRNVQQGATGAKVFIPLMASEKSKGGLFRSIKSNLADQLAKDPNLKTASYRLGLSNLEFTMNRDNRLIGIKVKGVEQQIGADDQVKRFIERSVIGKVPTGFTAGTVFDAKDVAVPEFLWMKSGFTKDEVVTDEKGNPIKNKRGETKIVNTPERQARFQPDLDTRVVAKDPEKMQKLFEACVAASERKGVPVSLAEKADDGTLNGGAKGYFSREFTEDKPNGYIVIDNSLEITEKCAVLLHEMGHADLHKNLEALAQKMGEEKIPKAMREVQAEAVAYSVASTFGIETDTSSFNYLAAYARGFDLQDFQKSLDVIFRETQALTKDIQAELDLRGLNLDLTEKPKERLDGETLRSLSTVYLDFVKEKSESVQAARSELPNLVQQSKDNPELMDVLKYQKENLDSRAADLDAMMNGVEALNNAASREEQETLVETIEAAMKRVVCDGNAFEGLSERYITIYEQAQGGLKVDFDKNPTKTLEAMKKDYPELAKLSKPQIQYIAASKFVGRELSKLLRNNPQEFVDKVTERAAMLTKVAGKNGTFVEVTSCEQWTDQPIFEKGTLCSPKIADTIVQGSEAQVRGMKAEAEKRGDYFPYAKCDVTIYAPNKDGGLTALHTRVDIGDGAQTSLKDHLEQVCKRGSARKELLANFQEALTERANKNKIRVQDISEKAKVPEKPERGVIKEGNLTKEQWGEKIDESKEQAAEKAAEERAAKATEKSKKKSGRNRGEH